MTVKFLIAATIGLTCVLLAHAQAIAKKPVVDQARLQNLQTIEQWATGMRDDKIGALTEARLADLGWAIDEEYSRSLFKFALVKIEPGNNDDPKKISAKTSVKKNIAKLIARHDAVWARTLLDELTTDKTRRAWSQIETARDLLEDDPKRAAEFAQESLKTEVTQATVGFLRKLREKDAAQADRLFVAALNAFLQQPTSRMADFPYLGTYLFFSPQSGPDSEGMTVNAVGGQMMPNLGANRSWITSAVVEPYLRATITLIQRPSADINERSLKYALGYMMVPKANEFAPNLSAELVAAMGAMSTSVPAEFTNGKAYQSLTKQPSPPEERMAEIEKNPDSYIRDRLYMDMALNAAHSNKFELARTATDKIEDSELKATTETVVMFAEINQLLKAKTPDLDDIGKRISKMPESLERCLLALAASAVAKKSGNKAAEGDMLDSARVTARKLNTEITPFVLMYAAGESRRRKDADASSVYDEAVKEFNKYDKITDPDLTRRIELMPKAYTSFPLAVRDVNLSFVASYINAVAGDEDNAVLRVNDIRDERLRGDAYVALATAILAKPSATKLPETVLKLSESDLRRTLVKSAPIVYPAALLSSKASGNVTAELRLDATGQVTDVKIQATPNPQFGAAATDALKQWKFKPAERDGKPIGSTGLLSLTFSISAQGKGQATLAKLPE